jgi:hypothetical protein
MLAMFESRRPSLMKILKMYLKAHYALEIKTIFSHQIGQT